MIALNGNAHGPLNDDPLFQGAIIGAAKTFGKGTGVHDPYSVATEVVEDAIPIRHKIKDEFAFGVTAGSRKAVSHLRRATVEKRHREVVRLADSTECKQLNSLYEKERREKLLFHIFSLSEIDACYIFARNYLDWTFETIKVFVDDITNESRTVTTHRVRYGQAIGKLQRTLPEEGEL